MKIVGRFVIFGGREGYSRELRENLGQASLPRTPFPPSKMRYLASLWFNCLYHLSALRPTIGITNGANSLLLNELAITDGRRRRCGASCFLLLRKESGNFHQSGTTGSQYAARLLRLQLRYADLKSLLATVVALDSEVTEGSERVWPAAAS